MNDGDAISVIITPSARAAIHEIGAYIADQGAPIAGEHMVARLLVAIEGLRHFPMRGRPRGRLRELVVGPYVVRYRLIEKTVIVTRVRHSARRPD